MTSPTTKKVNQLTLLGNIQGGDVLVGERTDGTTVRLTYVESGGDVDSVNGQTGVVVLDADDISDTSTTNKFTSEADETRLANTSGTNTGDQTSIVGISGTKTEFNSAVSDGNILYEGDVTQYTDELAQDAVGGMIDASLTYVDGTPLLQRAALTGDVTASAGSNTTTIANDAVTYAKMQDVSDTDKILGRSSALAGNVEEIACTAAGRAILDDVDASAQRTTLGLGTLATQSGTFSGTSSGTNTGDQSSIVGMAGTKAQFDTECSDGNFVFQSEALGTPSSGTLTNCTGLLGTGISTGSYINIQRGSSSQSIDSVTLTKIQLNNELTDTDGTFDNATNYRHTPSKAGKWLYVAGAWMDLSAAGAQVEIDIYKNGVAVAGTAVVGAGAFSDSFLPVCTIIDMNGSTDYIELFVYHEDSVARNCRSGIYTCLRGILLSTN